MMPLPKISAEESASLADLLSKILRYEPQQRISLEDITQHPWLTAPAESKSHDVSAYWLDKPRWSRSVKELGAESSMSGSSSILIKLY